MLTIVVLHFRQLRPLQLPDAEHPARADALLSDSFKRMSAVVSECRLHLRVPHLTPCPDPEPGRSETDSGVSPRPQTVLAGLVRARLPGGPADTRGSGPPAADRFRRGREAKRRPAKTVRVRGEASSGRSGITVSRAILPVITAQLARHERAWR